MSATGNSTTSLSTTTNSSSNTPEQQQPQQPQDLTLVVQDLLEQMESKFHHMGTSIIGRIDEMGSRIDELEQTIGTIMDHAGIEPPNGVTTTSMGATSNHNTIIATPTSTMRSDASI
eukprot:CAMPEP_0198297446 /NCGR_PEP_ID=MMETSP1449-20131203/36819_1 /TAXON_ID=420275 /ORGANISM="Attheya septentrionalis, Strain CCMP2084" /LENGTH=116 /DNA_ID=CAMNT_0043998367 /DNA_START=23 /DNA_END=373 /DNA_ORIENTATION=+